MTTAQEIGSLLLDREAVKVSINPPFTWTSGIKSPVYCDNRKLISYPTERSAIVKGFVSKMRELNITPDFVGGTATAAIPWAAFVAHELNIPMVYIRPEPKAHGAGKQVEGELPTGKRVLIIEDLISTGGSSVKAAQAVQSECGGIVTDVMAIVTYEMAESIKNFTDANLRLTTLTTFPEILTLAREKGTINESDEKIILDFKHDPRSWGSKHGF